MKRLQLLLPTLLLIAIVWPKAAQAQKPNDILVLANTKVAVSSISIEELRTVFLKSKTTWGNGQAAVPIHAPPGSALRAEFLRRVLQLSAVDEARYWEDQKMRRGLTPPSTFENTLKAVFMVKGSVAYIRRKDYRDGVAKVVLTLPAE